MNCLIAGEFSNNLTVTPTAPPSAVRLRLASVHQDGFDITWCFPQQFGDATVSGYQLLKDGKLYRNIIDPDVSNYRVDDVEIGQTVTFQMISLTNNPVGKYTALQEHPNYTMDQPQREFITNNLEEQQAHVEQPNLMQINKLLTIQQKYPACKPGPALTFKYTGLVKTVTSISTEKFNGFSALINFQIRINLKILFIVNACK